MNKEFMARVVRSNWHVLLVMAGVLAVAVYQALGGSADAEKERATTAKPVVRAMASSVATAPVVDVAAVQRMSRRDLALEAIRENEAELASTNDPVNAAACMSGIANLYFQRLQNYEAAAGYYERVLSEHADAPCVYQTFVNLALCYERLNQPEKRLTVLRRMLTKFSEESQEYAYAYSELYGSLPKSHPIAAADSSSANSLALAKAVESTE